MSATVQKSGANSVLVDPIEAYSASRRHVKQQNLSVATT